MAAQVKHAADQLRVLVFTDSLSNIDKQDIEALLTGTIQLHYSRKQIVLNIWSLVLEDTLAGIAEYARYLDDNDIPPYDWVVPLLNFQKEGALAPRLPGHSWPLCAQTAAAADSIASRTLLTTVPYFINENREFVAQINKRIVELAKEDKRYLLNLSFLFSRARAAGPNPASICYICDVVARYIANKQLAYDDSETKLVDTLFAYSDGDVNPLTVETDAPYTKNIERTSNNFDHEWTKAKLADLRGKLERRFVQEKKPLPNINMPQNIAQAKRTQTQGQNPMYRITRPDRVHAENYRGSSSRDHRQSKDQEEAGEKENWPPSNHNTNLSGGTFSRFLHPSSTLQSVSAGGAQDLRQSNVICAGYLNKKNNKKRTHQGAFHEMGSSIGDQEEFKFPRPNMSHHVFNSSYKTGGKSHKEKKKRGKIVVLRYPPKAERGALSRPPANNAQRRGGTIILGDEQDQEKDSSPSIPMAEKNSIGMDFSSPPRAQTSSKRLPAGGGNSSQRVVGDDGRVYIDPLQRQVSDAALAPRVANPLDLIALGNVPNWDFIPDFPAADVISDFGDDFIHDAAFNNLESQHFAHETGTVDPRDLRKMTSDDIIEAHLPVLRGLQEVYPDVFRPEPAIENPLVLPALQLNGDNIGMIRDSIPNPLNLAASHPAQYHSPYQVPPAGSAISAGQTQKPSPTPTPRTLAPAPTPGFGLLVPPVVLSQPQLPSPVTAGFVSKMHDDLRTVRGTPEPGNNSASLPAPHNFSIPQSSPQHRAPEDVRQQWRKELDKNVRWGNCSFCGMEKDDPRCGHVITNRQEPAETEITRPEVPVAEKQANVQAWLNDKSAQADGQQKEPNTQGQVQQMPIAQIQDVLPQESQVATATQAPSAEGNVETGTATPSPAVATVPMADLTELASKAMSSMPKTTERGGYLHTANSAALHDTHVHKSQGQAQEQSNIQLGPEEDEDDEDDTACLSEVQLGKRPMPNEGWRRIPRSDKEVAQAKPQKKSSKSGSEQGSARLTDAALQSVEDHDKENGFAGPSNSDPLAQYQAQGHIATPFALSQEARKASEKAYKSLVNTADPVEKAKLAYILINSGEQQPRRLSLMDVAMMEAYRAFSVPGSSDVAGMDALGRTPLPSSPLYFAVPKTPQMFAVPQNPMLAAMEGNPLSASRPTSMPPMATNPLQLPHGQSPLPTFAPATPASYADSQSEGSSSSKPQSAKPAPKPRVKKPNASAQSEDGQSAKIGRPKSEPKPGQMPRPSRTKEAIATRQKERELKAAEKAAREIQAAEMQARYAQDVEMGNTGWESDASGVGPQGMHHYLGFGILTNKVAAVPARGLKAATPSMGFGSQGLSGQSMSGQRPNWSGNLQNQQAYVPIDSALMDVEMRDTATPVPQAHGQVDLSTPAGEMKWKSLHNSQVQTQRVAMLPTSSLNPGMRIADHRQARRGSPTNIRRRIEALEACVQSRSSSRESSIESGPRASNDGRSCKYCKFRGEVCSHDLLKA